jgi:methylated-DNA-[protein]-cysteine S-methyltransferase
MKRTSPPKEKRNPPSSFSERVLQVVRNIRSGHTLSYKEVATKAGSSGASRAVGSMMAKNVNPEVPCHRVVKSNGEVGNYNRGGEKAKRAILKREGAL